MQMLFSKSKALPAFPSGLPEFLREVVLWTIVPGVLAYFLLWGGATFPIRWYQNRGAEVAVQNCWYALIGIALVVAIFCGAWMLERFRVRRPWSIAVLTLSVVYGAVAYGGALLMMYGVTPALHRFANDPLFFALFLIPSFVCFMIHVFKSIVYARG